MVQTDAGIETHAEVLLHLRTLCLPTGLDGRLTGFQILRIILTGEGKGFVSLDMQRAHHRGDDEFDLRTPIHPKISRKILYGPLAGDAGIGECRGGVGLFEFQDAQLSLGDTRNLIAALGDGIDGVA